MYFPSFQPKRQGFRPVVFHIRWDANENQAAVNVQFGVQIGQERVAYVSPTDFRQL
jgi:hypothetical protein